jgi:hypothetical protein
MNKASCLSLLSNAVLVWNTVRIAEIVDRLRASGEEILDRPGSRFFAGRISSLLEPTRSNRRSRGSTWVSVRIRIKYPLKTCMSLV